MLEKEEVTLLHLIPIPHLYQKTYFSLISEHDYIIKYRGSYIPTTKTDDSWKSISEYKICKRKQPNIMIRESNSCEATLLRKTTKAKCHTSPFLLQRETFLPIQNGSDPRMRKIFSPTTFPRVSNKYNRGVSMYPRSIAC